MLCTDQLNNNLKLRLPRLARIGLKNHCLEYKLVLSFCRQSTMCQKFKWCKRHPFYRGLQQLTNSVWWNNCWFGILKNLPTVEKLDPVKGHTLLDIPCKKDIPFYICCQSLDSLPPKNLRWRSEQHGAVARTVESQDLGEEGDTLKDAYSSNADEILSLGKAAKHKFHPGIPGDHETLVGG